jgi:hypothetical protein
MGRKSVYPVPFCEDEAFFYAALGVAPSRPRNKLERNARAEFTGRYKPGRPCNLVSRTQGALAVTQDLVDIQGCSIRAAAAEASKMFDLKSADNVRRQLRMDKRRVTVALKSKGAINNIWGGLNAPKIAPSFLGVIDMSSGEISQATSDPDDLDWLKQQASILKNSQKN